MNRTTVPALRTAFDDDHVTVFPVGDDDHATVVNPGPPRAGPPG
ncbi:hypothetical protein ACFY1P_23075 [Streptomyces sp. NPDC001407]